jgi:hypothetical protein
MLSSFKNAGWIVAFVALCAVWTYELTRAARHTPPGDIWICPILGQCGPPGTPGLGRW